MTVLFTTLPPLATVLLFGGIGLFVGRGLVCYADWFRRSMAGDDLPAMADRPRRRRLLDALPIVGALRRPAVRSDRIHAVSAAAGGRADPMNRVTTNAGSRLSALDSRPSSRLTGRQALTIEAATALAFAAYVAAALIFEGQRIEMVAPAETWRHGRILYHLVLVTLLIAATTTDLIDYVIPDEIPLAGVVIGVAGAFLSGDLQMVHLWMDWNQADLIVDGRIQHGAYIPLWIRQHHHWHGLAWSAAGLAAGGGIVWLLRTVSSLLLGREAVGFGDVTLMAMLGSFIGWQPVCFVVLLAPLCGVAAGFAVKLVSGRTFIAFGPYLCFSTFLVLCTWRWLWEPTRDVFGHVPSLALLAGVALGGLVALLILLRVYRAIPVDVRRKGEG